MPRIDSRLLRWEGGSGRGGMGERGPVRGTGEEQAMYTGLMSLRFWIVIEESFRMTNMNLLLQLRPS